MSLSRLQNIQHAAYRCRDAEQTRWFYEDVLGLKCRAALAFDEVSGAGIQREYMHLFFEMGDGNMIAFFDDPGSAEPAKFVQKDGFDIHVAFEIDAMEDLEVWKRKIKDARIKCAGPIDHGFVRSIYFFDPNGIQLEITCKTPAYMEIMEKETATASEDIRAWAEKTRARKLALFGAEAIDSREVAQFQQP